MDGRRPCTGTWETNHSTANIVRGFNERFFMSHSNIIQRTFPTSQGFSSTFLLFATKVVCLLVDLHNSLMNEVRFRARKG